MGYKAYKFRIYPDELQIEKMNRIFGCVRFSYNHFLARRIEVYEKEKRTLTYQACAKELVLLKKEKDFLKEADSIVLQQALRHLDTAFQNFFRDKKTGFPKFKSKKKHRDSYTTVCVNQNIRLEQGHLLLPKVKWVKIRLHREVPEDRCLKSVTVSRTPGGRYFASLLYEYEEPEKKILRTGKEKVLGLDFSMEKLFVSSEDGVHTEEECLRRYRKNQGRLLKEQRHLSRCKKGSRRYERQRRKTARLHERISDQRKDYLHKKSRQIVNAFDIVCVEDLDMKGMSQALHFGKSVHDNGWGMFLTFLSYKLEKEGKMLIKIDRWYPSSKRCHICGWLNEDLELKDRQWKCTQCGTQHDRDWNAAMNIKKEGTRILMDLSA